MIGRLGIFAAALLASSPLAAQSYVVDTGKPVSTSGFVLSPNQQLGGYVTFADTTTLSSIEGYLFIRGVNDSVTIAIYGDGTVPAGNPLYSATFLAAKTTSAGAWQGVFNLDLTLAAGGYWIGFAATGDDAMESVVPSPLSRYAYNINRWERADYLNVGVRIASQATPLPEPAGWALTILGIGAVGAAVRRRGAIGGGCAA